MKISEIISKIITDAETGYTEIKRGKQNPLKYNQREIINRINCYLNDQYVDRADEALFWNISNPRITHFTKLISPDTKDFYPYGLGEMNFWQAWALRKKVKQWFDESSFYKVLNDTAEGLSTYGSTVWKKYKDENGKTQLKEVNLLNLYFNQTVECINDTNIVEKHYLSKAELWEKDGVWDNVKELLGKDTPNGIYEINEYWGFVDDIASGTHEYKHYIVFGEGEKELILWEENTSEEDCPYIDFHLGRYRGRWMRVGVVERLFQVQARTNELVNQNSAYTAIASLLLLKSENPDATGNALQQAETGDIIGDPSLQQVGITNLQFNQFIAEMNLLNQQADRLCLTPEIIQGESSPSNTTFRGIAVVNAGAITAFKNYRQDFFEKIASVLMMYIFPELVKNWKKDEFIIMAEDDADIEAYDKALKEEMKKNYLLSGVGNVVTPQIEEAIGMNISENIKTVGRKVVPDNDFWNFKWGFKMVATDESVDKSAKNDAYFNSLQMTMANPAITDVSGFKQYCEDNGISPWKLTPAQQENLQNMGGRTMPEPKQPDQLLVQAQQLK